jgi:hypothetical protein
MQHRERLLRLGQVGLYLRVVGVDHGGPPERRHCLGDPAGRELVPAAFDFLIDGGAQVRVERADLRGGPLRPPRRRFHQRSVHFRERKHLLERAGEGRLDTATLLVGVEAQLADRVQRRRRLVRGRDDRAQRGERKGAVLRALGAASAFHADR